MTCAPEKTQINMSICACRIHDIILLIVKQFYDWICAVQMPRLIWVFVWCAGHFVCIVMLMLTWGDTEKPTRCHVCPAKTLISLLPLICLHLSRLMTKPTKWHVHLVKTQISLGIRSVWSESSLSAWRKLGSLAILWVHSKDSDQTWQMPRLICLCCVHSHFVMRWLNSGAL